MVDKVTIATTCAFLRDFDSSKGIEFQKTFNDHAPKSLTLRSYLNKGYAKCLNQTATFVFF